MKKRADPRILEESGIIDNFCHVLITRKYQKIYEDGRPQANPRAFVLFLQCALIVQLVSEKIGKNISAHLFRYSVNDNNGKYL